MRRSWRKNPRNGLGDVGELLEVLREHNDTTDTLDNTDSRFVLSESSFSVISNFDSDALSVTNGIAFFEVSEHDLTLWTLIVFHEFIPVNGWGCSSLDVSILPEIPTVRIREFLELTDVHAVTKILGTFAELLRE